MTSPRHNWRQEFNLLLTKFFHQSESVWSNSNDMIWAETHPYRVQSVRMNHIKKPLS